MYAGMASAQVARKMDPTNPGTLTRVCSSGLYWIALSLKLQTNVVSAWLAIADENLGGSESAALASLT